MSQKPTSSTVQLIETELKRLNELDDREAAQVMSAELVADLLRMHGYDIIPRAFESIQGVNQL